ncbi:MAG: DnaA regulatory inactivator Hda [Betaproteobacteria bacterium]|nr:DnaA regulatory inactivator Hda [Betaproteobacteria bacterium]
MKQLVLNLCPDYPPTLENFVLGSNAELLENLAQFAVARHGQVPGTHLYLWGNQGSGRSHLLRATVARALDEGRPALFLNAEEIDGCLPEGENTLLAVDDVDRLPANAQVALFNAFNRARAKAQSLLLSGPVAPRGLAPGLREDLRTRIGQSLIFEVRPLDDATRRAILYSLAARRGLRLTEDVAGFLLTHARRDPPGMAAVLDALDTASLEHKRRVTLPLLRELMQQGLCI